MQYAKNSYMKIIKKQPSFNDDRKEPLFYSFKKNNPHYHSKKNQTESLRSFNLNDNKAIQISQLKGNHSSHMQHEDENDFDKVNKGRGNSDSNQGVNVDELNQIEAKEKKENEDDFIDYDNDIRLEVTLQKLGLNDLIHVFNNFNISFNDLLFLEKEDLDEMQLHLYQKNRLLTFINEYKQNSSQYTIGEILIFFNTNTKYKALAQNNKE